MNEADVLILGGGLAGLATASCLGARAVVLEAGDRPGGLVRSVVLDGYWFDHVLHLLYFPDETTANRVRAIVGDDLRPCVPEAWVHARSGCARFPLQANLADLPPLVVAACLADLPEVAPDAVSGQPANYEEMLIRAFGRTMFEEFFGPYNRKMWKRPLSSLCSSGFQWNLSRPEPRDLRRGAVAGQMHDAAYNADGWYPRPGPGAPRGMECVSRALARRVTDLRTRHEVRRIHLGDRRVVVSTGGGEKEFSYRTLVSTLPLPAMMRMVEDLPPGVRALATRLPSNRVLTPCFCVRGPRPAGTGHWRYFADPALGFTRLVFLHVFDPDSSPPDGWGLMAEIPEPREWPMRPREEVLRTTLEDIRRSGYLPDGSQVVGECLLVNDWGYVVFEIGTREIASVLLGYLRARRVEPLGRFGRWEYSSMAQIMRDAFTLGDRLSGVPGRRSPDDPEVVPW